MPEDYIAYNECFICSCADDTVRYCGACRKWLCARCRRNPLLRAKAAIEEALPRIFHN